jgi:hypothetical protein
VLVITSAVELVQIADTRISTCCQFFVIFIAELVEEGGAKVDYRLIHVVLIIGISVRWESECFSGTNFLSGKRSIRRY